MRFKPFLTPSIHLTKANDTQSPVLCPANPTKLIFHPHHHFFDYFDNISTTTALGTTRRTSGESTRQSLSNDTQLVTSRRVIVMQDHFFHLRTDSTVSAPKMPQSARTLRQHEALDEHFRTSSTPAEHAQRMARKSRNDAPGHRGKFRGNGTSAHDESVQGGARTLECPGPWPRKDGPYETYEGGPVSQGLLSLQPVCGTGCCLRQ